MFNNEFFFLKTYKIQIFVSNTIETMHSFFYISSISFALIQTKIINILYERIHVFKVIMGKWLAYTDLENFDFVENVSIRSSPSPMKLTKIGFLRRLINPQ